MSEVKRLGVFEEVFRPPDGILTTPRCLTKGMLERIEISWKERVKKYGSAIQLK